MGSTDTDFVGFLDEFVTLTLAFCNGAESTTEEVQTEQCYPAEEVGTPAPTTACDPSEMALETKQKFGSMHFYSKLVNACPILQVGGPASTEDCNECECANQLFWLNMELGRATALNCEWSAPEFGGWVHFLKTWATRTRGACGGRRLDAL